MSLTADTRLGELGLPDLHLIVEQAFSVYIADPKHEDLSAWSIQTLADRAHQSLTDVIRRLESLQNMTTDIEISATELDTRLKAGDTALYLLDVREPWEFEIAHIAGSQLVSRLNLSEVLPTLKDREVITICHHGVRSLSAAYYLKEAGLTRVRSLQGGVEQWATDIDSSMAHY